MSLSGEEETIKLNNELEYLKDNETNNIGQMDASKYPRYTQIATFARLPQLCNILPLKRKIDIGVVGVPWDNGVSYRSGARFGPNGIREASRILRPYNIGMKTYPFNTKQIVDFGDINCTPYNINQAIKQIQNGVKNVLNQSGKIAIMGGDHTISYPVIKSVVDKVGKPIILIHFDAHLDTYPATYGEDVWHGSPFRKCFEDNLIDIQHSIHIGTRNTIWSHKDFIDDEKMGFKTILCKDVHKYGCEWTFNQILKRIDSNTNNNVYISLDIDVLDVSQAPGTGTPEVAGLFTHQINQILFKFKEYTHKFNIVGCDVVEVAPCYDHSQITSLAAANILYQLITLMCFDSNIKAKL